MSMSNITPSLKAIRKYNKSQTPKFQAKKAAALAEANFVNTAEGQAILSEASRAFKEIRLAQAKRRWILRAAVICAFVATFIIGAELSASGFTAAGSNLTGTSWSIFLLYIFWSIVFSWLRPKKARARAAYKTLVKRDAADGGDR
jgi:hypothetical protein